MTRRDLTSEVPEDKFDVEAEARRRGIQPYQVRATHAVGDRLVRDLVSDAYKGISQSASMIAPSREPATPKGNGWVEAAPLVPPRGRWRETEDEKRSRIAAQQAAELAVMENKTQYRAKTEYDPLQRFDGETPSYHREKS
jgi:hypothetical protein